MEEFGAEEFLVNEVIEIELEDGNAVLTRYEFPDARGRTVEGISARSRRDPPLGASASMTLASAVRR